MSPRYTLQLMLQSHIDDLATTLQPNTIASYQCAARSFIRYLQVTYPQVRGPSQLRRDPHILGFLRSLHQQQPPLKPASRFQYLVKLRRLLSDLAADTRCRTLQGLLVSDDFPALDAYLPKPLSPQEDQLLDRQLRSQGDLLANALLLLRATGMRIGECRHLRTDCLHPVGPHQWALKVPLGKLHTERWIPVDDDTRAIIARLLALGPAADNRAARQNPDWLLLHPDGRRLAYQAMRKALAQAALQAGCTAHPTPHCLRHSYATEMIRAGVSLPALMHLLGHKSIRMTLRYVQVSPNDLHSQYHQARCLLASKHLLPKLPLATATENPASGGMLALRNSLATAQLLLANFRLQLSDPAARRKLARLANRLVKISSELRQF